MTYPEWNEHIASYFFKPENAGKNILFYLTKQDLIKYSRAVIDGLQDEEIWTDFINAITFENGPSNNLATHFSPITRPFKLWSDWNRIDTPPFIGYLILYIIPLTETYDEHFNATNYYGKVNVFFKKYRILNDLTEHSIGTLNFQTISHLWNALEEWVYYHKKL
jgi:hypothetical protein